MKAQAPLQNEERGITLHASRTATLPFWARLERQLAKWALGRQLVQLWNRLRKRIHIQRYERFAASNPASLLGSESRTYSQFGEDGVLAEIFRRIGEGTRFCVEFGIESGEECNTRLLLNQGWHGLLMDGSTEYVSRARDLYRSLPGVQIQQAFITVENIRELFTRFSVPCEFDLLSIDIDGNDYWVLAELLEQYRPRVIVLEYNARWTPPTEWVMPYNPTHTWDGSVIFGASLASFAKRLARAKYTLVYCNRAGNNAFFVSNHELAQHFPVQSGDRIRELYAPPLYAAGFGHPVNPPSRVGLAPIRPE